MKKIFLFLGLMNFTSAVSGKNPVSIYDHNNYFSIYIPYKNMLEGEVMHYLPQNINPLDMSKIEKFIKSNSHTPYLDYNGEYKLDFYINNNGAFLKNISINHFQTQIKEEKTKKPIITTVNITKDIVTSDLNTKIVTEDIRIIWFQHFDSTVLNKNGLSVNLVKQIFDLYNKVTYYLEFKKSKIKNPTYYFTLCKTRQLNVNVIAITVKEANYQETFYVFNTPQGGRYLLINNDDEILFAGIVGMKNYAPVIDSYKKIGSKFGLRRDPMRKVIRHHSGQDLVVNSNSPVLADQDGIVVDCGYNKLYGFFIVIHSGNASKNGYSSVYAHLNKINVKFGQPVKAYQIIGLSGSTGKSTGPHLHYEIVDNFNGKRLNPLRIICQIKKIDNFLQTIFLKQKNFINLLIKQHIFE